MFKFLSRRNGHAAVFKVVICDCVNLLACILLAQVSGGPERQRDNKSEQISAFLASLVVVSVFMCSTQIGFEPLLIKIRKELGVDDGLLPENIVYLAEAPLQQKNNIRIKHK